MEGRERDHGGSRLCSRCLNRRSGAVGGGVLRTGGAGGGYRDVVGGDSHLRFDHRGRGRGRLGEDLDDGGHRSWDCGEIPFGGESLERARGRWEG